MFTRFPDRGTRVAEVLRGTTVERFTPTAFQKDYEVIRCVLTPFTEGRQVEVARAIHARSAFNVLPNGSLIRVGEPPQRRLAPSLERRIARLPEQTYAVELRFSLTRTHPSIYSLDPIINRFTRPKNRHLFDRWHPEHPDVQALCVYPPHLVNWNPTLDDPYPLLTWLATYLACDAIQHATGDWLGLEAPHDLRHVIKHGNGQCWCGSGRPLQACHRSNPMVASRHRRF